MRPLSCLHHHQKSSSFVVRGVQIEKKAMSVTVEHYKKAQLSLTNPRDAKACQKLLQFDVLTTLLLTLLAYLHSFSCCCVRNLRNPAKFTENSNLWSSRSFKVIDLGVNRKPICDLLLVINNNFSRICYRFPDIYGLTPPSGGTPWDIVVVYTPLNRAFNGLQFRRWHYRSIFIRLAVVASQSREITQNSDKIWPYSSSRSSKVIDLGVNRKVMYDFLLVTNSNFGRICYRFPDIDA